jgi:hypothetical protein
VLRASLTKAILTACLILMILPSGIAVSTDRSGDGTLENDAAVEQEVDSLNIDLPEAFLSKDEDRSSDDNGDEELVSTLSFNFIHYILCKFKMTDIL